MTKMHAHLTAKAILITMPTVKEQLLLVEIEIDCPACGKVEIKIPGHHLKALRNVCTEMIDLHHDLTGDDAGLEVIKRMQWTGLAPEHPGRN